MSYQGWYSKKDVLKDLRKATGKYVYDLDEASVLVGEQPPPLRYNIPDDETEQHLLRLCGARAPAAPERARGPDLSGITELVRMVNSVSDVEPRTETKSPDTLLRLSKLNPNVKEFIPKSSSSSKCDTSNNKSKTDDICDDFKLNIDMKKIMRERLKDKIAATSHTTCVVAKRERNLAIQSLLKLHCVPQTEAAEQKPKLISPAYFEKSNLAENKTAERFDNEKLTNGHNSIEESADKCPETEPSSNNESVVEIPSSYIAASVDKVQKWLHASENAGTKHSKIINKNDANEKVNPQSETQKELTDINKTVTHKAPYLGPVTFKRKASSKPMSPTSTVSNECVNTPKKIMEYKPSKYAAELVSTYKERSKLKVEQDLWTKLEAQLKAKDEEIRKKQAEANPEPEGSI